MFVKICGLTDSRAVAAAVAAGADAVGFVFADSPREVTPERACELAADLPKGVLKVAVMHHPSEEHVRRVLETFAPDWLQTDAEDFDRIALPQGVEPLPVFRHEAAVDPGQRVLFEGAVSGAGRTADWHAARILAARARLILAGGLDADNVAAAIRAVRPWGVDVSSGVERARGAKDPDKIASFVDRVRAQENLP
jgi:phosphoribosylanthranilate isomerase